MKIALTYTGSNEKHQNYVQWLKSAAPAYEAEIEVVPIGAGRGGLMDVQACDGLLLSGGLDVHPSYYKKKTEYANAPAAFDPARDELEIASFRWMQELEKPVLAVCRGMQLINCFLGGTLVQDLGGLNKVHRAEQLLDKAHGISIEQGTLLHEICGYDRQVVNSAHHQAVRQPGNGLIVNCRADDGTIEGLERKDRLAGPFLLCIQWHPERLFKFQLQDTPLSKGIRERFLYAVKKNVPLL